MTKPQPQDLLNDPVIRNNFLALQSWLKELLELEFYIKNFYLRYYPIKI